MEVYATFMKDGDVVWKWTENGVEIGDRVISYEEIWRCHYISENQQVYIQLKNGGRVFVDCICNNEKEEETVNLFLKRTSSPMKKTVGQNENEKTRVLATFMKDGDVAWRWTVKGVEVEDRVVSLEEIWRCFHNKENQQIYIQLKNGGSLFVDCICNNEMDEEIVNLFLKEVSASKKKQAGQSFNYAKPVRREWKKPIVVNGGAIFKRQFISFDNVHVSIKNKQIHIDDIKSIKVQPWPNSEYEITIEYSDGIISKRTYIDMLGKDIDCLYKIKTCVDEVIYEKYPERRPEKLSEKEIRARLNKMLQEDLMSNTYASNASKDASVIKRGIVGAVIGGPAGAVVGALSAIDKNNKNRSK